ncbi:polysaccharide deacetylase family protein [Litorilinea aerophila]|uniref:Polysaccharide deacetylase family protein n=1 Tax=Litorilinea aerophila TaxID=1204385 RepID=A0A540VD31_9CHLR|nr:polysaccharide deacetylase family protein [Litorilinea aerophila]MCC9077529.1 polysaccharide deacetylase family protein [Litorilinea aerophila]
MLVPVLFLAIALLMAGCGSRAAAMPRSTATPARSAQVQATPSPTSTRTPRPSATPTRTPRPTQTPTATAATAPADTPTHVADSPLPTPSLAAGSPLTATASTTATLPLTALLQLAVPQVATALASPVPGHPTPPTVVLLPTPTPTPLPSPTPPMEPTPDGVVRTVRVPILMYHYISVPPPGADIYRQDLSVKPEDFAAHLDAIQEAGYTTISLYDLIAHLTQGAPLPEKPVILTFDDGYRDNYENAFPRLRERGMIATFFVVTDFIDEQRPEYLTWDMAREMYAAGMSIESHGRNHISLKGKDDDYLVWQALGSLETIEYELGVRPRFVSYPAGDYDQRTIDIFRSANYWAGLTTIQGATHRSDNLFELRRVRVRGTTTPQELLRLLALDW